MDSEWTLNGLWDSWQHNVQDGLHLQMVTVFGQKKIGLLFTAAWQVVLARRILTNPGNIANPKTRWAHSI